MLAGLGRGCEREKRTKTYQQVTEPRQQAQNNFLWILSWILLILYT